MDGSARGADWQIVLLDSTLLGNIRYTLQIDDGDLLYVRFARSAPRKTGGSRSSRSR